MEAVLDLVDTLVINVFYNYAHYKVTIGFRYGLKDCRGLANLDWETPKRMIAFSNTASLLLKPESRGILVF